jgi:hypothetical protein
MKHVVLRVLLVELLTATGYLGKDRRVIGAVFRFNADRKGVFASSLEADQEDVSVVTVKPDLIERHPQICLGADPEVVLVTPHELGDWSATVIIRHNIFS